MVVLRKNFAEKLHLTGIKTAPADMFVKHLVPHTLHEFTEQFFHENGAYTLYPAEVKSGFLSTYFRTQCAREIRRGEMLTEGFEFDNCHMGSISKRGQESRDLLWLLDQELLAHSLPYFSKMQSYMTQVGGEVVLLGA